METLTSKPWPLPREGAYLISFRASRFPGALVDVESAEGLAAMVENIRHVSDHSTEQIEAMFATAYRCGGLLFSEVNTSREDSSTYHTGNTPTEGVGSCNPCQRFVCATL